jgi:hypothetical protein
MQLWRVDDLVQLDDVWMSQSPHESAFTGKVPEYIIFLDFLLIHDLDGNGLPGQVVHSSPNLGEGTFACQSRKKEKTRAA